MRFISSSLWDPLAEVIFNYLPNDTLIRVSFSVGENKELETTLLKKIFKKDELPIITVAPLSAQTLALLRALGLDSEVDFHSGAGKGLPWFCTVREGRPGKCTWECFHSGQFSFQTAWEN